MYKKKRGFRKTGDLTSYDSHVTARKITFLTLRLVAPGSAVLRYLDRGVVLSKRIYL